MASTFSTDLALELVATGEKAGLWGSITNTNLQILEQSASGYLDLSLASGSVTFTVTGGGASFVSPTSGTINLTNVYGFQNFNVSDTSVMFFILVLCLLAYRSLR